MSVSTLQSLISPLLDENTLKEILRKYSGLQQIVINDIKIADSNLTKGYSYLSSVIKFVIEGTGRESTGDENEKNIKCPIFVKTLPKNIGRRKSFRSTDFFRNEVIFYNDIWSVLSEFQDSKNLKNKFNNIPHNLAAFADGTNDYIALEDLSAQSYIHFKKEKELDYNNVLHIMRLFARFHALSFAFKDQYPEKFEELSNKIEETYFHEKFRKWYIDFQKSLFAVSRDAIEKELPPFYLTKFDKFINNDPFKQLSEKCNDKSDKLAVFNQGDSWIPNFLVKYGEDNKVLDIKMIDFQLARCCSPFGDIGFFLYSSTNYDLLFTHWEDIMKDYHSTFVSFLSDLGSNPDIFTYEEFQKNMKENMLVGFCMAVEAIPFQLMDESEAPDLDTIEGTEEIPITTMWKVRPIKHKIGRQKLANVFKHIVDNEFLHLN